MDLPDTAPLLADGQTLVTRAQALVIGSADEFELAATMLRAVATLKKSIKDTFDPIAADADKLHKKITGKRAEHLALPEQAERILKTAMGAYQLAAEKLRLEAERKAQTELVKAEEERRLAEAAQQQSAGNPEVAEAILDAPTHVPVVSLPKLAAKGISTRKVLKYRIIDPAAVKREYCSPDEKKIGGMVIAMGHDAAGIVGGIQVYEEAQVSVRTWTR